MNAYAKYINRVTKCINDMLNLWRMYQEIFNFGVTSGYGFDYACAKFCSIMYSVECFYDYEKNIMQSYNKASVKECLQHKF